MNNPEQAARAAEARMAAFSQEIFAKMLERPEIKLLISMVPASEPPELLQTLLRTMFDAGAGQAGALTTMLAYANGGPSGGSK